MEEGGRGGKVDSVLTTSAADDNLQDNPPLGSLLLTVRTSL